MPDQPLVLEATRDNFPQLVLANSRKGPVLVDFWASWAGPSRRQRELLLRLAQEYAGRFLLVTVDTDRQKEIAREYAVKSLPSCKLFRNGEPVEHIHGMQTEADYRELIERHIVPLADKAQAAALKAWQCGDRDKAVQVLAEAAMAEPDNPSLPLLLAKLLMQADRHEDAYAVLNALPQTLREHPEIERLHTHLALILAARDTVPEVELEAALGQDPADRDTRFALASLRLMADDFDAALDHLAELQRRAPDYRGGLPQKALMVLLDMLDPDDERGRRYRRALFDH
ncbi:MAG: tetratricopeptide repeat protein [Pseudomonadota bacterium]|nr:tetratricopeptide repeat protein [Pseudomonadota bacterium]